MPKVLAFSENGTKIGAFKFPDRKKVCLGIEKGNEVVVYGTFNSMGGADEFMNELADFVGALKGE